MKRLAYVCLAVVLCWGVVGCTGSGSAGKSDGLKPEQIVDSLLKSMKAGNKTGVASLLTNTARIETAKAGLDIQPPAMPNAAYKVLEAVLPPEDPGVAHVSSIWSEGEDHFEIIWVLRQEPIGWRVAGMALTVDENQDPLFCNFENPAEMLKVTEEAVQAVSVANGETTAAGDGSSLPKPALNPLSPVGQEPGLLPVQTTAGTNELTPINKTPATETQTLAPLPREGEFNQARQPLQPQPPTGFENPIRKR